MSRVFFAAAALSWFAFGCDKPAGGTTTTASAAPGATGAAAAAGETSCDQVVAKLMSLDTGKPGDAEKKFYTKMCADLPPAARTCIAAAKTGADRDACMKDVKLK